MDGWIILIILQKCFRFLILGLIHLGLSCFDVLLVDLCVSNPEDCPPTCPPAEPFCPSSLKVTATCWTGQTGARAPASASGGQLWTRSPSRSDLGPFWPRSLKTCTCVPTSSGSQDPAQVRAAQGVPLVKSVLSTVVKTVFFVCFSCVFLLTFLCFLIYVYLYFYLLYFLFTFL